MWPIGTIQLPLTLTSHEKQWRKKSLIKYIVIQHPTEHNIIMGRTTILKLKAILSTMHEIIKFSTTEGPCTVLVTLPKELQCFEVMCPKEIEQECKKARVESTNRKEIINEEYPDIYRSTSAVSSLNQLDAH